MQISTIFLSSSASRVSPSSCLLSLLDFPRVGLSALLAHYCGVTVDKRYQQADWRTRPLSSEMIKYARQVGERGEPIVSNRFVSG